MIYLDYNATSPLRREVLAAMLPYLGAGTGNASSAHAGGRAARAALEQARRTIAAALCVQPSEIVFTSGGTESNNLAIFGSVAEPRAAHLLVSPIEHASVLRNVERLASSGAGGGFTTTEVPPAGATGVVAPEAVAAALRPDTSVVAVMLVNNELGTVQPVAAIARVLDAFASRTGLRRPHLHVDAVQAFGFLPVRAASLGADSLALSAHKIHGGKGAGALWLRAGARVTPLWDGGRQERGLRSGTENVPAIVGFGRAAALARAALAAGGAEAVARLRDELEARVLERIPGATRTIAGTDARAPHISSLSFPGLPAEPLLHALEARGVLASAGSACASKTRGPSHVLKAVGVDDDTAVLRLSLSRETTADEIARAASALEEAATELGAPAAGRRRRA